MSSRVVRAARFTLAFASFLGSVATYGHWIIGEVLRDDAGTAIPTTLAGITLEAAVNSLIPGLVVATLSPWLCRRRPRWAAVLFFVVCFFGAWSYAAFQTAWSYRANFGNTWTTLEVLLGLVWLSGRALMLMATGLIVTFCLHLACFRDGHPDDSPS